jgi:hypothetical protein
MIRTLSKLAIAVAVVLLSAIPSARALMADGTYTINAGVYVPLWDISGDYSTNSPDFGSIELEITQQPKGEFTGDGTLDVSSSLFDGEGSVTGALTVSGSVSGSSEKPAVSMNLKFSASDFTAEGIHFQSLTENATVNFSFNFTDDVLVGNGNATAKAVALNPDTGRYVTETKSEPIRDQDLPLPSDTTGDWTLTLNLTPASGTKYTGTAQIVTSAGTELGFTVTGTYSSKTGVSDLTLKGAAGNLTLNVTTSGDLVAIESISGKIFGQSLSYKQKKD